MHTVHLIIDDAPEVIAVPEELRGHRLECIFVPLDETGPEPVPRAKPKFNIADVEDYDRSTVGKITLPSREERNARR